MPSLKATERNEIMSSVGVTARNCERSYTLPIEEETSINKLQLFNGEKCDKSNESTSPTSQGIADHNGTPGRLKLSQ